MPNLSASSDSSENLSDTDELPQDGWELLLPWGLSSKGLLHWLRPLPVGPPFLGENQVRYGPAGCAVIRANLVWEGEGLPRARWLRDSESGEPFSWCGHCHAKLLRTFDTASDRLADEILTLTSEASSEDEPNVSEDDV